MELYRIFVTSPNHSTGYSGVRNISRNVTNIYVNWNQAAVPAGNTHRANAQCRRYDTKKNRVLHSVVHVSLPFNSRSVLVLVNVLNRLLKLTISGAIVTTLRWFCLVTEVSTRRRRRWRLHHPFRNIGQQIYHCNLSDYAFVSRQLGCSMV